MAEECVKLEGPSQGIKSHTEVDVKVHEGTNSKEEALVEEFTPSPIHQKAEVESIEPRIDMDELVRNITSVVGGFGADAFPTVKTKVKRKGRVRQGSSSGGRTNTASDIETITASVMKEVDKKHQKVWRYFLLNQKNVVETCSNGEIVNLYTDIRKMYPGKPLMPLWTLLNEEPVLLCFNRYDECEEKSSDEAWSRKHTFLNRYANSWFGDCASEFRGQCVLVPMNQTKYVEMRVFVKTHLNKGNRTKPTQQE